MLITHATVATLGDNPRLIEDGAILIQNAKIVAVDTTDALTSQYADRISTLSSNGADVINAQGQLALPACLCGHTHFYGAFARGWAYPGPAAASFVEILERLWWRLDKRLTLEDVRYATLVCLVDAIRHGTTTLIDHHASPGAITGSLDVIAEAVVEAGVRASLCYEVTDRDGAARAQAGIEENVRFLRRFPPSSPKFWRREQEADVGSSHPQLAASFGLHASLTLSDETLAEAMAHAQGAGFHLHAAEGIADVQDCQRRFGKRVVQRLHDAGVLGPRTILAHAVHVDAEEIALLAETGTWVTHQPRSNMNNAVGFAPVEAMVARGVNVALGNDGFSNNMFAEMKAAYLGHKLAKRDPRAMPGDRVFALAYKANAQLARVFWPDQVLGALTPGAMADIILVDYKPTTPLFADNLPWHLLFGYEASAITTTISAGKVLMKNRVVLALDEEAIVARSRELAAKIWERV
jgi:putative selenium metabolism protein SsnA